MFRCIVKGAVDVVVVWFHFSARVSIPQETKNHAWEITLIACVFMLDDQGELTLLGVVFIGSVIRSIPILRNLEGFHQLFEIIQDISL
jgi:hypothetical protein